MSSANITSKCRFLALFILLSQPCSEAFTSLSVSAVGRLFHPPINQESDIFQQSKRPSLPLYYTNGRVELPLTPNLPDTSNPYVILKIHSEASEQQIKRSYRVAALKYHPDMRLNSSSTLEERAKANEDFARINAAYALLSGKDQPTSVRRRTPPRPPPQNRVKNNAHYDGDTSGQDQEIKNTKHEFARRQTKPNTNKYTQNACGGTTHGSNMEDLDQDVSRFSGPDFSAANRRPRVNYKSPTGTRKAYVQNPQTTARGRKTYTRQSYGGTSFDAQTARKVDHTSNRYVGTYNPYATRKPRQGYGGTSTDAQAAYDAEKKFGYDNKPDNFFARRSYARPAEERTKYTREGYGGTSTDAKSAHNTEGKFGRYKGSAQVQTSQPTNSNSETATIKPSVKTENASVNPFFFMKSLAASTHTKKIQSDNKKSQVNSKYTQQQLNNEAKNTYMKSQGEKVSGIDSQMIDAKKKNQQRTQGWPYIPRGKYGGTSSDAGFFSTLHKKTTTTETTKKENRKYGDFFDANSFHARWNSSNSSKSQDVAQNIESQIIEDVVETGQGLADQLTEKLKTEAEEMMGSLVDGLSTAVESMVSNLFTNLAAVVAPKTTSIPSPAEGQQFSPLEACAIIYEHEVNPSMDKQEAITIMLNKHYVPVKEIQLYSVYTKFKEGKISSQYRWGDL